MSEKIIIAQEWEAGPQDDGLVPKVQPFEDFDLSIPATGR